MNFKNPAKPIWLRVMINTMQDVGLEQNDKLTGAALNYSAQDL